MKLLLGNFVLVWQIQRGLYVVNVYMLPLMLYDLLCVIVFMSPEYAVTPPWKGIFGSPFFRRHLAVIAVDEAHCISDWQVHSIFHNHTCILLLICLRGSDFRNSFFRLGVLQALSKAPFIALTASAPPHVQAEILSSIHMHDPLFVSQPLDRPNIYMSASKSLGVKVIHYMQNGIVHIHFLMARLRETSTRDIHCYKSIYYLQNHYLLPN